jgi:predicted O-methyltransferase YrrM
VSAALVSLGSEIAVLGLASACAARGVFMGFPDGHFYSPVPDPLELEERASAIWGPRALVLPGIDFNDAHHLYVLTELFPRLIREYDYPETGPTDDSLQCFYNRNSEFGWLDSRTLFVLMRARQPGRIVEVGSGYSSLLMADVNARFLAGRTQITCVEPFPRPFLRRNVPGIGRVIERKVQDVPLEALCALGTGDWLFIDSSHVCKVGSDVNTLFLEVVPRLKPGVKVHVHDVFLPEDYPRAWVTELGYYWSEQYLLRALLSRSDAFRVLFGCHYAALRFPNEVSRALPLADGRGFGGGSFWFEVAR